MSKCELPAANNVGLLKITWTDYNSVRRLNRCTAAVLFFSATVAAPQLADNLAVRLQHATAAAAANTEFVDKLDA